MTTHAPSSIAGSRACVIQPTLEDPRGLQVSPQHWHFVLTVLSACLLMPETSKFKSPASADATAVLSTKVATPLRQNRGVRRPNRSAQMRRYQRSGSQAPHLLRIRRRSSRITACLRVHLVHLQDLRLMEDRFAIAQSKPHSR